MESSNSTNSTNNSSNSNDTNNTNISNKTNSFNFNKPNNTGPCITIKKSTLEKLSKNILVYFICFI